MIHTSKANRAVRFFCNLKHTTGKFHGQPFIPLDWEEKIIRDVYGTLGNDGFRQYQYVYLEIPKKNGKTEMVAGAANLHTFADGEYGGQVFSCAAEKGQASIAFDVAFDMVGQSPELKKRCKPNISQKRYKDKVTGTEYRAISAEAYSKHGLNVSACIFDELHAQPNRDLWDTMTFGAGDARRQPIWWVITTAGDDPDRTSIGWEVHEKAQRILSGDLIDPRWYPVIYGYDGEDIWNEASWYAANPSLGHTIDIEKVRDAARSAKESPAERKLFEWLRLNRWLTNKLTSWLDLDLFDKTEGKWTRQELAGLECYPGLDLSSTTDLTAKCLVFPPQQRLTEWRVIWDCYIPEDNMRERIKSDKVPYNVWAANGWVITTPGNVIDYTRVEADILKDKETYQIKQLVSDPALATMFLQRLTAAGIDCVPQAQGYKEMTDPINAIETMLKGGQMTHERNDLARWCFGNASISDNGQGYKKLVKESKGRTVIRTKRIDPIIAWVNSMARAQTHAMTEAPSIYESRGIRVL